MPMPTRRLLLLPLGLLALAACGSPVTTRYYLLETGTPMTAHDQTSGELIGLREVSLPLYARRQQIALRQPGGDITVSDTDRWATEPARAISGMIANRVSAQTAQPVIIEPWPLGSNPEYLVQVETSELLGAFDGELRFAGQIRISRPSGGMLRTDTFDIRVPVDGASYGALSAAQAEAVTELSDRISTLIEAL